ncbi:MAG: hypothetical protein IJX35_03225 [Candidatus Methanomethylophilaceae archaeon]|nr:hypothetical protein [Candidatus Methanomethylophilaceae archaeon]
MKRQLAIVLFCAILTSTLASCGGAASADTTAASGDTTAAPVETELTDGLPDTDMNGFEFRIASSTQDTLTWANVQLSADSENGETVNGVSPEQVLGPRIPGASVSYTGDTVKCGSVVEGSKGVSVLVHECTYMASETELAADHFHSTAIQAAEVARDAGVRCLMLTHVSNRYDDRGLVEGEARTVFGNSIAVNDMDWFDVMPDLVRPHVSN